MRDPEALPSEEELQSKIPWPCLAKRSPGEAAQGGLQARSLGPAERKELQSEIPRPCRVKRNPGEGALESPQAKSFGPAERRARFLCPG